ncbi:hypothetical protein M0812_21651 [Anaeramoeba flamelloides]|uniref:Transmembrane protein n=1 Tax=Anaeramoeba flamelloides TaxID=1746091 RepID=A0AAV7YY99_9EUKA|nr:hypothetical protein M0812_21651 [Anaeramoeba flamelloides]
MTYYDDNTYDNYNSTQRSGISDETKQFLVIFFTIFGVAHAIAIIRGIIKYGTICNSKNAFASSANQPISKGTTTQIHTKGGEIELQEYGQGMNQDILNLAEGLIQELNNVKFSQGTLNQNQMNMNMNMNMGMGMNNNTNFDQPPQYNDNSNNLGGGMFVGQNNTFGGQNNNFNTNTNMNMNNSQNEEMNKIIDRLEIKISNLGQSQQNSQLMNLVENLRLIDNITQKDIKDLAAEFRSIASNVYNDNQQNEELARTKTQSTTQNITQDTPIESFDPASLFMQYLFTFIPKFVLRMVFMGHLTALFAITVVTWALSIVETIIDIALRIVFYVCSPPEVRNKSSQIIEEKISFVFLNFITIFQLALILYFPLFTWFWKNTPTSNQLTVNNVTPQNGICEKEWKYKPTLGKVSSMIALVLAYLLSYAFGAF